MVKVYKIALLSLSTTVESYLFKTFVIFKCKFLVKIINFFWNFLFLVNKSYKLFSTTLLKITNLVIFTA